MNRVIFCLGVLIFYSCSKTEIKTPATVEVQEEAFKFSISPDISTNSYTLNKDTFDFAIAINSKIPSQGILYSIEIKRVDTNLTIYKIDTSSAQSSTNFKAVGLNIKANYYVKITITSKSTSTNTVNQNYTLSRSRIYKNYLRSSYELSNNDIWFSSAQLYKSDGSKYVNNPFIDEQSVQLDIDGDGLEDVFYFESYDLQISPTPNPYSSNVYLHFFLIRYNSLNVDVLDFATGRPIANRVKLPTGSNLNLQSLSTGVYVIKVYSSDMKFVHMFKVVKL